MLSISKLTCSPNVQRVFIKWCSTGSSTITTAVPEHKIPEFCVQNERIYDYLKDSKERIALEKALDKIMNQMETVPIVIDGKELESDNVQYQVMPHDHQKKIAKFSYCSVKTMNAAIDVAICAQRKWDKVPISKRIKIWQCAASLMAGKYRAELNAATMLGQAKTMIQAEIDSAAELVDFFRWNAYFVKEAHKYSPLSENPFVTRNTMRYRGIDGFIAAVTPFNFTAIAGNLAFTPALMGNAVLWKPSDTAMLSNWIIFKACREAGVPPGVVNFIPADGPEFGDTITASKYLAGINFTGSVATFTRLWGQVGENINCYKSFPRLIGECGGKNYHFVHPSADITSVVTGTIRSAFEYSGQKCSACSRMYVPESLWPKIREGLLRERSKLKIGDPTEYDTFTSAVIDCIAFKRIKGYIKYAKECDGLEIIAGGNCDDSSGYFIEPTIITCCDPYDKLMVEEVFGPVLSVYVYPDCDVLGTLDIIDNSTAFALTGSVFAKDEDFFECVLEKLKMSAGNFYINDKSTGSVVGQQPFGGARLSGTNDKAGGPHYVLRWGNPQTIKETFVPLKDVRYPYMTGE